MFSCQPFAKQVCVCLCVCICVYLYLLHVCVCSVCMHVCRHVHRYLGTFICVSMGVEAQD